ncbi:hypothetical protein [Sulfuricurvum sp.]|uniref:hypothetical protein n=1 Tax=Sulfuricurvum sp. TaxID=2025608 RepID=UPI003565E423
MTLTPEKKELIKEATLAYKHDVEQLNRLLEAENDDERREKLFWLRAIASIEQGYKIGLFDNEELDETQLDAMGQEAQKHFHNMYDPELVDDIALLDDDMKNQFFDDPLGSKKALMAELKITL